VTEKQNWYSESLARGLVVLRAFCQGAERLRMTDVAERAGLTRAAARRYLLTLRELGYVGEMGGFFYLRPRILDLGYSYIASVSIEELVEPVLEEIAEQTKAATHFAVLDADQCVILGGLHHRYART
jgi:IclR family pca regulon transcriptional regulator